MRAAHPDGTNTACLTRVLKIRSSTLPSAHCLRDKDPGVAGPVGAADPNPAHPSRHRGKKPAVRRRAFALTEPHSPLCLSALAISCERLPTYFANAAITNTLSGSGSGHTRRAFSGQSLSAPTQSSIPRFLADPHRAFPVRQRPRIRPLIIAICGHPSIAFTAANQRAATICHWRPDSCSDRTRTSPQAASEGFRAELNRVA